MNMLGIALQRGLLQENKKGELWIRDFAKQTGLPITVIRLAIIYGPGDRRLLKLFKMAHKGWMPLQPVIYPCRVAFFTKDRVFNNRKIGEVLDFSPRRSNREGVKELANWYVEHAWLAPKGHCTHSEVASVGERL